MKSTGLAFKSRDYIGSVEPPATVLEDESRFGNDGAFFADGKPDWVQLPSGLWVMDFNGSDAYGLIVQTGFDYERGTIEMWFTCDSWADGSERHLFGGKTGATYLEIQKLTSNRRLYWALGAVDIFIASSDTFNDDIWYHLVIAWDFGTDQHEMWMNVVSQGTYTTAQTAPATPANVYLGCAERGAGAIKWWDGKIALPKLYRNVLSKEQVAAIYQAERHWFGK